MKQDINEDLSMIRYDFDRLTSLRTIIDSVIDLTGNIGKRVRRVLEQFFPAGAFDLLLQAPVELSLFQFACYLDFVRDGCEVANDIGESLTRHFHFAVVVADPLKRLYRLQITPQSIPESMKDRQAFLRDFGAALEGIISMMALRYVGIVSETEDLFFPKLFTDDLDADTPENRKAIRDRFERLLEKNFAGITDLPVMLVDLAAVLVPEISEALREAIESSSLQKAA